MIVTGETAFLILRARSYMGSTLSELERADTDPFAVNTAAFNLAMAAELLLKHLLLSNGAEPSQTHKHKLLLNECGEHKITVPKEFRQLTPQLYYWESSTRYEADISVTADEVRYGHRVVEDFMKIVYDQFMKEAYRQLSVLLSPQELEGQTSEQVVLSHLDQLEKSV